MRDVLEGAGRKKRDSCLAQVGARQEYELRLVDNVWLVEAGSSGAEAI